MDTRIENATSASSHDYNQSMFSDDKSVMSVNLLQMHLIAAMLDMVDLFLLPWVLLNYPSIYLDLKMFEQ